MQSRLNPSLQGQEGMLLVVPALWGLGQRRRKRQPRREFDISLPARHLVGGASEA